MTSHPIKVVYLPNYKLAEWGPLAYAKPGDAGFDLRAALTDLDLLIRPGETVLVPCGIKIEMPTAPEGFVYELQIRSRSGLAAKSNIMVLNSPGTVDSGFRGEVQVTLHNVTPDRRDLGLKPFTVAPGDRIAQAVLSIVPVASFVTVESENDLSATARGVGGIGSSGVA